jgi:hypothetical protein
VTIVITQLLANSALLRLQRRDAMCLRDALLRCADAFRSPPLSVWMFYAKGVNCCAEVRMLLDMENGDCPPVGDCRGVAAEGNCGDLAITFADTPVLPYFPDGLAEYTCHAFPDDERPVDSLVVALIAFALALPVTLFCKTMFEVANDNEAPEVRALSSRVRCARAGPDAERARTRRAG